MKSTLKNDNDSTGELQLISFIENTISRGYVDTLDHLERVILDYINSLDGKFVHGHRPSEYFEVENAWHILNVHHLNSKAERDRIIVKVEL